MLPLLQFEGLHLRHQCRALLSVPVRVRCHVEYLSRSIREDSSRGRRSDIATGYVGNTKLSARAGTPLPSMWGARKMKGEMAKPRRRHQSGHCRCTGSRCAGSRLHASPDRKPVHLRVEEIHPAGLPNQQIEEAKRGQKRDLPLRRIVC